MIVRVRNEFFKKHDYCSKIIQFLSKDQRDQKIREEEGKDISEKQYQVNKMRADTAMDAALADKADEDAASFSPTQYLADVGMADLLGDEDTELAEVE